MLENYGKEANGGEWSYFYLIENVSNVEQNSF
jgi:hypothetical protein